MPRLRLFQALLPGSNTNSIVQDRAEDVVANKESLAACRFGSSAIPATSGRDKLITDNPLSALMPRHIEEIWH